MKLIYTVEIKNWDNEMEYPEATYQGESLLIAMSHFKEQHLKGEDVVLFIEDEEGNNLDTITNYNNTRNDVIHCNDFFTPSDDELKKENKEAIRQKEIYNDKYNEELSKNDQLKKDNERLYNKVRQQDQKISKLNEQLNNEADTTNNTLFWYAYRLRGFSPFCQPKGYIQQDSTKGRHGIIAYDRKLTDIELEDYELVPYEQEKKAL